MDSNDVSGFNFYSLNDCEEKAENIVADNEIDIFLAKKSKIITSFNEFFASFTKRIASLRLNDETKNNVYQLCRDLVEQTQTFNMFLLGEEMNTDPKQILSVSSEFICGKLDECSTAYRRKKKCEKIHIMSHLKNCLLV